MRFVFVFILWFAVSASRAASPLDSCAPAEAPRFLPPHESAAASLARLPRNVEFVLIVDDIQAMADSPMSQAIWGIITSALPQAASIQEAWGRLAQELALDKRQTLDRLVGTRLVLVMRDVEHENSRRWAIASAISEQTDRDLIARLRPARRAVVEGHAIRSIEGGAYEVATHLHEDVRAPGPGGRPVTLFLSEAGKSEVFDELVAAQSGRKMSTLADTEAPKEAERFGPADMLLAIRLDPDVAGPRDEVRDWQNFLIVAAKAKDKTIECRMMVRDRTLEDAMAKVPRSSDAPLAALSGGAIFTIIESSMKPAGSSSASPAEMLFSLLGLEKEFKDKLNGRLMAVVSEPRTPDPAAPNLGLSVTFGAETDDLHAAARLGDASMQRMIEKLENPVRPNPDAPEPEAPQPLAGVVCDAVRRTEARLHESNLLARFGLFDQSLNVAWSYAPAGVPEPVVVQPAANAPNAAPRQRGWWFVNLGPTPLPAAPVAGCNEAIALATRTLQDVGAPAQPIGGELRNWFSLGVLRPARCVPLIKRLPLDLDAWQSVMKRVERVEWKLSVTPSRDVEGSIIIEPAPTK